MTPNLNLRRGTGLMIALLAATAGCVSQQDVKDAADQARAEAKAEAEKGVAERLAAKFEEGKAAGHAEAEAARPDAGTSLLVKTLQVPIDTGATYRMGKGIGDLHLATTYIPAIGAAHHAIYDLGSQALADAAEALAKPAAGKGVTLWHFDLFNASELQHSFSLPDALSADVLINDIQGAATCNAESLAITKGGATTTYVLETPDNCAAVAARLQGFNGLTYPASTQLNLRVIAAPANQEGSGRVTLELPGSSRNHFCVGKSPCGDHCYPLWQP